MRLYSLLPILVDVCLPRQALGLQDSLHSATPQGGRAYSPPLWGGWFAESEPGEVNSIIPHRVIAMGPLPQHHCHCEPVTVVLRAANQNQLSACGNHTLIKVTGVVIRFPKGCVY